MAGLIDPAAVPSPHLTPRQRLSWFAHLFKACFRRYHREIEPVLARFVERDGVVIDIGGHSGQFAKLFARLVPEGRVYTVEPNPYAVGILRRALAVNRIRNVSLLPVALSDSPGSMALSIPVKRSGSLGFGLAHMGDDPSGRAVVRHEVPALTLDSLAAQLQLPRVDFIKADIEGWEMRALAGAAGVLEQHRPTLLLEVQDDFLARAGDDRQALFGFLGGLGYRGHALDTDTGGIRPLAEPEEGEILFAHRERAIALTG